MSLVQTIDQIEYPESDGKPMGETDVHIDWMIRIRDILRCRYRGQEVYVGANLLVYYREGDPSKFVVPDDFVVKDCSPGRRRTFKIWEEGKAPNVVFEITSRSSRGDDQAYKPQIYARLGVPEYFLYDPTAEYLDPPLQGFRLDGNEYTRIKPDETGAIKSDQLGISLRLEDDDLVLYDSQTGERLLDAAEAAEAALITANAARRRADAASLIAHDARDAAEAARDAEKTAHEAEKTAREAAEARAAQFEAELKQLRTELERKTRKP